MAVPLDTRSSIHIARQPILDTGRQVFGYELLYRADEVETTCNLEGDVAASRVLTDALLGIGLETLVGNAFAFLNFTRSLLLSGAAQLLPKKNVVIELREDIVVDRAIIEACEDLQKQGYLLALDDFVAGSEAEQLVPFARFIKIDVLGTMSSQPWSATARRLVAPTRRVIAERVERSDVAMEAHRAGCSLFQGFYFCRPATRTARALPAHRQAYLNLFAALNNPDLTIDSLEELIKRDVSLTIRVLRSINSAAFALEQPISTVRHALVLLGIQQVRQWASVWAMAGLSAGGPTEIVSVALVRARLCETLGRARFGADAAGEMFLLGMCSTLDVVLDMPMEKALATLPLSDRLKGALLGENGNLRSMLDIAIARERGYWSSLPDMLAQMKLSDSLLSVAYVDALKWAQLLSSQVAVA